MSHLTGITDANMVTGNAAILSDYSRSIDFVVLDSEEVASPIELESNVITLDGIKITLQEFINMFYSGNGIQFELNAAKKDEDIVNMKKQTLNKAPFKMADNVLRLYTDDLQVEINCLDACSVIDITNQLSKYQKLGDFCTVKAALDYPELIESVLEKSGTVEDTSTRYQEIFGGKTITDKVYHVFVVNIRIHNANPAVKDIYIKLNYNVEFGTSRELTDSTLKLVKSMGYFPTVSYQYKNTAAGTEEDPYETWGVLD